MWRFIISTLATIAAVWLLNSPLHFAGLSLPPLGSFLSTSHGFWQNAENRQNTSLIQRFEGIERDVEVILDSRMVPHIFATNDHDLYFAQGYITAMHRLWQMDIASRSSLGRISEVLGEGALNYDKSQLRMGMRWGAETKLKSWEGDPEHIKLIQSYADGINAYISKLKPRKYPVEFKLLDYAPEEWTPLKSAGFVMSMAMTLCSREQDLEFTELRNVLGEDQFAFYFPEYNPGQEPIIPEGTEWDFTPLEVQPVADRVPFRSPAGLGSREEGPSEYNVGSNNWAMSGSRTRSGAPILCNDPHLKLSLPSIWYEVQLKAPGQNCYGASLPGMPGVISGFSETTAWGMTNVGHDMLDWYQLEWLDKAEETYLLDGESVKVTYRIETIGLKDGSTVNDTVKYTKWGPVMKDGAHVGLAMRWIANEAGPYSDAGAFLALNRAKDVQDFIEALITYHGPAQNFVYADNNDNVALRIGGSLPLRSQGQGRFIADGANSKAGWQGLVPPDHNPIAINPKRGFVSSANQRTTDETYPYYYTGGTTFEDFRGNTLNRYLQAASDVTAEDMRRLQQSNFSLKAEQLLPLMLGALDSVELDQEEQEIINVLSSWDNSYNADQTEPVLFELWSKATYMNTWDEVLVFKDSIPFAYPEYWRLIDLASQSPDTALFDIISTSDKESFNDVVLIALREAIEERNEFEDPDMNWGQFRKTTIAHLGNIEPFGIELDKTNGHGDALNAISSVNGPSWRMVVELGDKVKAHVIYPGGQSGNPGSRYYASMVDDWANGNYYIAEFGREPEDIDQLFSIKLEHKGK